MSERKFQYLISTDGTGVAEHGSVYAGTILDAITKSVSGKGTPMSSSRKSDDQIHWISIREGTPNSRQTEFRGAFYSQIGIETRPSLLRNLSGLKDLTTELPYGVQGRAFSIAEPK